MGNLTYEDFKSRLRMQDLLQDIGYVQNRRDGLRYPSFVKLDEEGRRIRGTKFIVTQQGNCCFQPPEQKSYNIISFIKEHPEMFQDYTAGMNLDLLVNKVCNRLLNTTYEQRERTILEPEHELEPFKLEKYQIHRFVASDKDSQKAFYPYFKHRGINLSTQYAFKDYFLLASKESTSNKGVYFKNLSFPIVVPGEEHNIVGFEERGRMRKDGEKPYKGKAAGSNGSEGLWIASPGHTQLKDATRVYLFESAYDAMAYYQLKHKDNSDLRNAVFVSTGGNVTVKQISGIIKNAPSATFHLCFDNDPAGQQFTQHFEFLGRQLKSYNDDAVIFNNTPGHIEVDEEKYEAFSKLPEEVRNQYYKAFNLSETYATAYLSPEDKEDVKNEANKDYNEFLSMVDRLLLKIEREVPIGEHKDWNDELLAELENEKLTKKAVGTDIDGDGSVEIEESNEEKHRYHR